MAIHLMQQDKSLVKIIYDQKKVLKHNAVVSYDIFIQIDYLKI